MVSINTSVLIKLFVERLEDRSLPTTLPWPVAAADNGGLTVGYGQFDDRVTSGQIGRSIHFHEGIDILVAPGKDVLAIEDGTVAKAIVDPGNPFNSWVSVISKADPTKGWNYAHISPTVTTGDAVTQGKPIGTTIAAPPVLPNHLHLDATSGDFDPSYGDYSKILRPIADPLTRLAPLGDTTPPTLGDIHFMRASDDTHNLKGGYPTSIGTTM